MTKINKSAPKETTSQHSQKSGITSMSFGTRHSCPLKTLVLG